MFTGIKKESISIKQAAVLFAISLICGVLTAWIHPALITVAVFPMAISAGALAALVHFECEKARYLKFIASVLIIVSDWILNGFLSLGGIIIVALALMIFLVYEQKWAKCESTLIISLIVAGLIALMFVAFGLANEEKLSLSEYYTEVYESMKNEYLVSTKQMIEQLGATTQIELPSEEELLFVFDFTVSLLIAGAIVCGFLMTGIACKAYTFALSRLGSDKEDLEKWSFIPDPVYGYLYMVLAVLELFSGTDLSIFNLSVANLSMIFMAIFTYFGFKVATKFFTAQKEKAQFSIFRTIMIMALFAVFPRVLSYIGAFFCIIAGKIQNKPDITNE